MARSRHRLTELWSQVVAIDAAVAGVLFIILQRHRTTWRLVGVMFGWLVIAPEVFIAFRNLPRGFSDWREFWRFYEFQYQISLRVLAPIYALVGLAGKVSTAVLLSE